MKTSSSHESRRDVRPLDITLDLAPRTETYSYANRRHNISRTQRVYPCLLFLSTAIAGVFCFAYITKPVIVSESGHPDPVSKQSQPTTKNSTSASGSNITKEASKNHTSIAPAPSTAGYEETNIRMQHILDAESTSGDINRIVVEVPVLYKSRNLVWSQQDAAQARTLLVRLENYQEKSRELRDEGKSILADWNQLMDATVPNAVLRADSPSISANLLKSQSNAFGTTHSPSDKTNP